MNVQTKDSAHPYRPACLNAAGYEPGVSAGILEAVDYGRCPRCLGRLPATPHGSRATKCRCIPLCSDCSAEEFQPETYVEPGSWPLPPGERATRRALKAEVEAILEGMDGPEHEDEQHTRPREYKASDAALDALAIIQAVKIQSEGGGADAAVGLWSAIPAQSRGVVATTLAGWVITMNSLTAIEFDAWSTQIRNAALAMQERGE